MDIFLGIWNVIFKNIISQPSIFIGLIVVVGYALMKKKWYEIAAGFIRTVVGYMILQAGASLLKNTVTPLLNGIQQKWGIAAAVMDPNFGMAAGQSALESIGITTSFATVALLVAFIWNIVLVALRKYSKVRTFFTTGHIMVQQTAVATWIVLFLLPPLRNIGGIVLTGLVIGTYWSVFSNLTVEPTQELTEDSGFAIGHQQMLGIWLISKFAGRFASHKDQGDKEHKEFKLSGAAKVLDDYVVSTVLIMLLFFGVVMVIIGPDVLKELDTSYSAGLSFGVYIFQKCASFAVNLVILKTGIRMFVSEMVESFNGISSSALKGSIPAVDCAATLSFGNPNAPTLGFLFGAVGQIVAIAGLLIFRSPIMVIPGFVPLFYDNATLGLYANMKGGLRALVICCIGSGLLQVLGSAAAIGLFQLAAFVGYPGNLDWATLWLGIGTVINWLAVPGAILCIVGMLVIPQIQYRNNKENYFRMEE